MAASQVVRVIDTACIVTLEADCATVVVSEQLPQLAEKYPGVEFQELDIVQRSIYHIRVRRYRVAK